MKTTLYAILLLVLPRCGAVSKEKEKVVEDSLNYYPTTPVQLDQKEFRYYYRIVKNYFENSLVTRSFNGGILVAKEGNIVYERYNGLSDLRGADSMSADNTLHIASVSKTLTGMAVLKLVEQGVLSLHDSMGKFFPDFPYEGITVKMLLSHRSSLPNYLNYLKDEDTCYSNNDVLNSLYTLKPRLEGRPGTRFSYSNTNYILLAMIIEKVSGESYPAFMKKTIFDPLQMNDTRVYTSTDSSAPPSFNWDGSYWTPDPFDCTYGDKNIYSTPRDLLKWDQALYSEQLFRKATIDSAFTPLSNEYPSVHNYGLGWRMLNLKNGKKVIYHYGRWHGSNAVFVRLPDEKATIIIIGNRYNRKIYSVARKSYDLFGNYLQQKSTREDEIEDGEGGFVAKTLETQGTPVYFSRSGSR